MVRKASEDMGSNVELPAKVRIMLEDNEKIPPGGQFFGINGKSYLIQAGVEVDVPRGIIGILDDAVESVPVVDPGTMRIARYSTRKRFPYRNLGPVVEI